MQAAAADGDHEQSSNHFLQGLDAEFLEDYLEQGVHRTKQKTVKASLDDVNVAKLVEVPAYDVEQAKGDEREGVKEEDLVERPAANGTSGPSGQPAGWTAPEPDGY